MIYRCVICGKEFVFDGEEYTYKKYMIKAGKHKTLYFCGWNCMRKYEKESEKKQWMKK